MAIIQKILYAHGKAPNLSQVRYSIFHKNQESDLAERVYGAMNLLVNAGYGHLINGRFFKNPKLNERQLKQYSIDPAMYADRLESTKLKYKIADSSAEKILNLHKSLFS